MSQSSVGLQAGAAWAADAAPVLESLDHAGAALVARTEAWAAINSGSYEAEGLARMRAVLADAFAALPGALSVEALAPSQRIRADGEVAHIEHGAALRLRVRPEAPIQVALTGHYDTVFPAAHPFQATRRDGAVLHGPGTADMKGGLSVMLAALSAFEAAPGAKRVGYEVLLSPDEEIGSPASAALLAELGARAHLGMTYEPALADGALVDARKGSGNYSLVYRGKAAHVGRAFSEGRSAMIAAAEAALALDALNGKREGVTFNVGAIDGGGPTNVVPDRAVLRFNVRAPDAESAAWAEGEIERIAARAREGVASHLHGAFARPPKPLNAQQRTMVAWTREAGAALGLELKFQASGGVCEGNNLAAAGCPNIDTLGPCGGGLHSDQEFALIPTFAERAKLSFLLLHGLNSGRFDVASLKA
ncbi:MAG TPA: hydrolase [Terricaulis sp.]|nr:hydrolase [Terricaulis sp.]